MGERYIKPKDVNHKDASLVLDFLNKARSSRKIADAINIPGKKDVGIGIAERLIAAREVLGGHFKTLEQVNQVKQIGAKYFTQIIKALSSIENNEIKGVFNERALILNIPNSKLNMILKTLSPLLTKEDRFTIHNFKNQVQLEIVTAEKTLELVKALEKQDIGLSDISMEEHFAPAENELESFIEGLEGTGASFTSISFNTGPALLLPQNRTGISATEGNEGSIFIEKAPFFIECEESKILKSDYVTYYEYFAGAPTAQEKESVIQETYKKGIKEAHKHIPNESVKCTYPCFPIYSIIFGKVETSTKSAATASGGVGGSKGPVSGSVNVSGTLLGEVSATIHWSVIVSCVREGSGDSEESGKDANDQCKKKIAMPGGTTITVICPCTSDFAQEEVRVNFSLPYPISSTVGGAPPLKYTKRAIDEVVEKATKAASNALAKLQPCGPPCPIEQVTTIIGPINTRTVNNGWPSAWYPYSVIATCFWSIQRKCS